MISSMFSFLYYRFSKTLSLCIIVAILCFFSLGTLSSLRADDEYITNSESDEGLSPFTQHETKMFHDKYRSMTMDKLISNKQRLTDLQLSLNVDLNKEKNKEKLKDIRIRIHRIHQELAIVLDIIETQNDPFVLLTRYHKPLIIILLLIIILVTAKVVKTKLKQKADPNSTEPPEHKTKSTFDMAIESAGHSTRYNGDTPDKYNQALPIQDIQSYIDNMLLDKSKSYNSIINFLFSQAIYWHASDIHMQRSSDWFEIKYRIDGNLFHICSFSTNRERELINIVKVMSQLRFDEHRAAQDGRLEYTHDNKAYDFRISVVPIMGTEKIVARIFGDTQISYDLDRLGLSMSTTETLKEAIKQNSGLVLLVGPAGSGKTTTIYSSLNHLLKTKKGLNINTLEDPVEHVIEGVTQIQINPIKDLTFESGLANLLRQDPEVIMIGEIREPEVAKTVVRAAYTGHLVISTVHSISTVGAIDRLLELGVDPYNLHNSLIAVLSQRLVKQVCVHCMETYDPPADLLERVKPVVDLTNTIWRKGKGCDQCMGSGYSGRIVIEELLHITPKEREKLISINDRNDRRILLEEMINHNLFEDGVNKATAGLTTLEEVFDVLGERAVVK